MKQLDMLGGNNEKFNKYAYLSVIPPPLQECDLHFAIRVASVCVAVSHPFMSYMVLRFQLGCFRQGHALEEEKNIKPAHSG